MSENTTGAREREKAARIDRRNYLKMLSLTGAGLGTGIGAGTVGSQFTARTKAAPTVLDDFEDGDITEYTGHTSDYSVEQSSSLEGDHLLECSDNYDQLASTTTHGRGYRYAYRFIAGEGSDSKPGFLLCVQDGDSPVDSCYWFDPDVQNNRIKLTKQQDGSFTELDTIDVSTEFYKTTQNQAVFKYYITPEGEMVYDEGESGLSDGSL